MDNFERWWLCCSNGQVIYQKRTSISMENSSCGSCWTGFYRFVLAIESVALFVWLPFYLTVSLHMDSSQAGTFSMLFDIVVTMLLFSWWSCKSNQYSYFS
ncbi:uncharacterized protein PHALS_01231 [Plasmopara halstedii]|uniref:Uncharacterized protein n=1 Tax=Plasmopara halstedii TaxID=4781 RepID=A0A0P1ASH6_PLAHL|nr:uncharacterized protein PHALS_01231 [Plasmopara halstedii]CEG44904.1 hypothetical protein PHALS_01231 [Plasmopara halstedii]|eukprot:XP_024581273.1 hypothetical protein PHALS_01231 [Plasmopara halstedii]